jgi:hypothetical protein
VDQFNACHHERNEIMSAGAQPEVCFSKSFLYCTAMLGCTADCCHAEPLTGHLLGCFFFCIIASSCLCDASQSSFLQYYYLETFIILCIRFPLYICVQLSSHVKLPRNHKQLNSSHFFSLKCKGCFHGIFPFFCSWPPIYLIIYC